MNALALRLEQLYRRLNRRCLVHPDPLEFLYLYPEPADREIVALVASSLASGRVQQVLKSVARVLAALGPRPAAGLMELEEAELRVRLKGFVHRFVRAQHMGAMLWAAGELLRRYGSLQRALAHALGRYTGAMAPARALAALLREACAGRCGWLVPRPEGASPMKRLWLMMRWLVRRDEVDPGGWDLLAPAQLVVPLDTHMLRLGRAMGLIGSGSADASTAVALTRAFSSISRDDPVKYDFALTRLGIRRDLGA